MVAGHLTKRNGYYYAVLSYYDPDGKRHFKTFSTGLKVVSGNYRKAEEMLQRFRTEFFTPTCVNTMHSDMPFTEYMLKWLEIVKIRIKPTTFASYKSIVEKKINPYFAKSHKSLVDLKPGDIQAFYIEELKSIKPNSVIREHAVIHQALKYAYKIGLVKDNVAARVDRPRKNAYEHHFLNGEELECVFKAVRGTKFELPVLTAAFYGLRRGEVLGLKWDAIDFDNCTLTVKHTIVETNMGGKNVIIRQDSGKTKASSRTLPLVGKFREYFAAVKKAQEDNKRICGNCYNYDYDGYIFVDEMGNLIRPDYLSCQFPKFLAKHGLEKIRFHDLRHSCASLLVASGVPLKSVQEWLGHSDFNTTANIYTHLDFSAKITSSLAMERHLELPDSDFSSPWEANKDGDSADLKNEKKLA